MEMDLEIGVDGVKTLAVRGELLSDVCRAQEDRHQRLPLLLHVRPGAQHEVYGPQLSLPGRDLVQEDWVGLRI